MPELTKSDYLRVGQYVYLKGVWRISGGARLEDAIFKVVKADQFDYTKSYIIKQGEQGELDLEDDLSLYPEEFDTLYEIGVGMIGNVKLFIKLPSDKFYYFLEDQGYLATVGPTTEIGGFTEEMIPPTEPKVLREYTIRDMKDSIRYVLVNSSYKDEKAVLKFTVNRVKLMEVVGEEKNNILQNLDDYVSKGILRIIQYPREG